MPHINIRFAAVLAALLLVAGTATAGDPNLQKGFSPGKMYDLLGIDSVNTFNGNLNVRIPLGQTYAAGPVLRYQFMLAYNSKVWEFKINKPVGGEPLPPGTPRKEPIPDTRSNAGFGWRLTLGELYEPKIENNEPPPVTGWIYVAPDGSSHEFASSASAPGTVFTQDGSFLRLRQISGETNRTYEIDFPNGITHRFVFEPGKVYGRVTEIRDRYGNWVNVDYTSFSDRWIVTDGYGSSTTRQHTILIERPLNGAGNDLYEQENYKTRPVLLDLASAEPDGVASYTLHYDDEVLLPRGVCGGNVGITLQPAKVPLLESIEQPDGTTYVPVYQLTEGEPCTCGVITELTLPTRGKIAWLHGVYEMSFQECVPPSVGQYTDFGWFGSYAGVRKRTLKNETGAVVETRTYTPELVKRNFDWQKCGGPIADKWLMLPPEEFRNVVTVEIVDEGTEKTIEKTTNYFSVYPGHANPALAEHGTRAYDYGLPFIRKQANGGRFLSSVVHSCTGGTCSETAFARSVHLKYAYEDGFFLGQFKADNPRVEAQRTTFNLDTCDTGSCYTDVAHSDYDGHGHYRQTTYTGNFGGTPRTLRTEHNPKPAEWLLNEYTATSVIESGVTKQQMTYTWDHAGLQKSRRVLDLETADAVGDLLSVTCRDARGDVSSEKWFGGHNHLPPPDGANLCSFLPGAREYEIQHEYPSGSGFRSWHKAKYRGTSHYIVDEVFNPQTGLVTKTRDSAGLETDYAYDDMGRIKTIAPPGTAPTSLTYRKASSTEVARVTSTTGSATPVEQTYDYDGLGRLFREKRRMPDGTWALRKTDYRGAGATKSVSEWISIAANGNENVNPLIRTSFEQDQFGRTIQVTTPDNKIVRTTYVNQGMREVQRRQRLATPGESDREVIVTETFDMYGKLISVSEPSGPTSVGAPVGAEVLTKYEYDSGGKLVKVTMTPPSGSPQIREFHYDTRGMLVSESHPEKATTTYGQFDARGHAWTSTDGDVPLQFEFDEAERLTFVLNASGAVLKEFLFGTSADCANCLGKLRKAIRHNYLPGLGDHQVTETYTYGQNGLPSRRQTLVERVGSHEIQNFDQNFIYDELGAPDRIEFPTCTLPGCSNANGITSVEHTRTRGLLTSLPGYANITYHPSGMVNEVTHSTSPQMVDTYFAEEGMARPSKIKFSGSTACTAPSTPVVNAPAFACAGSTNQASVASPQAGVTYTWTITNGTPASATGTSVSFTAGASGQVTLSVTASNACGTAGSAPKTVTIPQAAIVSGNATINAGQSATIEVTLTGTPPWSLTWSDNNTVTSGITSSPYLRQVTPDATTTYTLLAATDATSCNLVRSGSVTITVRPQAPAWVTAQATNDSVDINWPPAGFSGARYDVERAANINATSWTQVATATSNTFTTDVPPADPAGAPRAWVYRVRTVALDGTRSPEASSPRDYAVSAPTMYPSGGITAGSTYVLPAHIVELRRAIDALRGLVNLPPSFNGQSAPSGAIAATHFTALLAPLNGARAPFGHGSFVYTGGVQQPAANGAIKAAHVNQLREVLR